MEGEHDVTVHATQALASFVALKCSDLQGPQEASCLSGVNKTSGNGKRATNLFFYKHTQVTRVRYSNTTARGPDQSLFTYLGCISSSITLARATCDVRMCEARACVVVF